MFRIDIAPLEAGFHHLARAPEAEALDLDPDTFSDIQVGLDLFCQRDRILVDMHTEATAALVCDRTLQPFEQSVEGHYSVLFAAPGAAPEEESEDYEEVREFSPTDRQLNLTDLVRDTLVLSLPQRKVAPGAEEEEIPTTFGVPADQEHEKPIDPRWEKLRELRSDDNEEA